MVFKKPLYKLNILLNILSNIFPGSYINAIKKALKIFYKQRFNSSIFIYEKNLEKNFLFLMLFKRSFKNLISLLFATLGFKPFLNTNIFLYNSLLIFVSNDAMFSFFIIEYIVSVYILFIIGSITAKNCSLLLLLYELVAIPK